MGKILNFKNRAVLKEVEIDELDLRFTTQLVVEIGDYKFELDEEIPWINIYKNIDDSIYELVDDIDILNDDYSCFVNTIEELKEESIKWYLGYVNEERKL